MEKDEHEVVQAIDKAIAEITLPTICTKDALENSEIHKAFWRDLRTMFINYFDGKRGGIFSGILFFGAESKIRQEQEALEEEFDYLLELYGVLICGWKEIERELAEVELPAKSPGQAFSYILSGLAADRWQNSENLANPTTLYRAWVQYKRCERLKEFGQLTTEESKKLDALLQRIKKKAGQPVIPEYVLFRDTCIDICSRSKNKNIRQKVEIFQRKSYQRADNAAKALRYKL